MPALHASGMKYLLLHLFIFESFMKIYTTNKTNQQLPIWGTLAL